MPPEQAEDQKKKAFRLYELGHYRESLELCRSLVQGPGDSEVAVLCATNLFHLGKFDEAEAYFRDLSMSLPASSHVHSYLGRILAMRFDPRAVSEYAKAVVLDPGNLEALRAYAEALLANRDPIRAIPVLKRLAERSLREEDIKTLARALHASGQPGEALKLWKNSLAGSSSEREYLELLLACGQFSDAANAALEVFTKTADPGIARIYLRSLARTDPASADREYSRILADTSDSGLRTDYVRFLRSRGAYDAALTALAPLLPAAGRGDRREACLLEECELRAEAGRIPAALQCYQSLIRGELESLADMDLLAAILRSERRFLLTHFPAKEAESLLLSQISSHPNVVCLLAVAGFYEDLGDMVEARSWYYRGFRSDFLAGGPQYAKFLFRQGDLRECEKIMLYVVNSIRKTEDLIRIAELVMDEKETLYRMPRLLGRLRQRLEDRVPELNSPGLELLALTLLVSASRALEAADYSTCKRFCLSGLDVLPATSHIIRADDFLTLVKSCKERSLCDLPVMEVAARETTEAGVKEGDPERELDLDDPERKIVEFLKTHRRASEMDLRTLLGSRRVVGIVNRIIQKASGKGLRIIEKKGIGEHGEIYEYVRA
jgi:tetratricopeptide (TPR) repeat protein